MLLSNEQNKQDSEKYRVFKQLIHTFYPKTKETQEEKKTHVEALHSIIIEPKIYYHSFHQDLKIEFKVGNKQLYRLKNLPEFYERMLKHESYRYGAKLEFVHTEEAFEKDSIPLLHFIMKYAEIIKYANESAHIYGSYARDLENHFITISNSGMDELFTIFENKYVTFENEYGEKKIFFKNEEPDIKFNIEKIENGDYQITSNLDMYSFEIIEGKEYIYFLWKNTLYKCTRNFEETTLKVIQIFQNNYTKEIRFTKKDLPKLFSIVFPKLRNNISLEKMERKEIEEYVPKELFVKLYLDFNDNDYLVNEVKFVYGETEFNPFIAENINIARDISKENEVFDLFVQTGFMLDKKNARLILTDDEKIYQFLSSEIETYMQKFEVLATNNFKNKEIREPKVGNLGVRIENNLLHIDFENMDFDLRELKEILQKYRLKKKYHRLKDGSFLKLEKNDTIQFIESITSGIDIDYKQIEKGSLQFPIYRSMYLERVLNHIKTSVIKDTTYKELVKNIDHENIDSDIRCATGLTNFTKTVSKNRI